MATRAYHTTDNPSSPRFGGPMMRPRNPARDAARAEAFAELEVPLEELRRATIIAERLRDDALTPLSAEAMAAYRIRLQVPKRMKLFMLTDDQSESLDYIIQHVGDSARKIVERYDEKMQEGYSPIGAETSTDGPDLLDLEDPLKTAIGFAKALQLMAVNPVGEGIDAEPVFVLGRDIEAALKTVEEMWTALVDRQREVAP